MKESVVVSHIESVLLSNGRFMINNHGSLRSRSGIPDFITVDDKGHLVAIEAKSSSGYPTVNQWRRAVEIVYSYGRYLIVSGIDFTIDDVDNPNRIQARFSIGRDVGVSDFEADQRFRHENLNDSIIEVVTDGL